MIRPLVLLALVALAAARVEPDGLLYPERPTGPAAGAPKRRPNIIQVRRRRCRRRWWRTGLPPLPPLAQPSQLLSSLSLSDTDPDGRPGCPHGGEAMRHECSILPLRRSCCRLAARPLAATCPADWHGSLHCYAAA